MALETLTLEALEALASENLIRAAHDPCGSSLRARHFFSSAATRDCVRASSENTAKSKCGRRVGGPTSRKTFTNLLIQNRLYHSNLSPLGLLSTAPSHDADSFATICDCIFCVGVCALIMAGNGRRGLGRARVAARASRDAA